MQNITIADLPKSTIKVARMSLNQMKIRDADVFENRTIIGQGTFGYDNFD